MTWRIIASGKTTTGATKECPLLPVVARATDRRHSVDLLRAGADLQVRETFESAVVMGAAALEHLGIDANEVAAITARIRARDQDRLQLEIVGGMYAGKALFSGRRQIPAEPQTTEPPTNESVSQEKPLS